MTPIIAESVITSAHFVRKPSVLRRMSMGSCRTGFHDLDGLTDNGCEYECRVTDLDPVDEDGVGANCDGFDGVLGRLIFVSTNGSDDGTGTPEDPVLTMAGALDLVDGDTGRQRLILAEGTYSVAGLGDIPAGVSLIAGYSRMERDSFSAGSSRLVDATNLLLGGAGVFDRGCGSPSTRRSPW